MVQRAAHCGTRASVSMTRPHSSSPRARLSYTVKSQFFWRFLVVAFVGVSYTRFLQSFVPGFFYRRLLQVFYTDVHVYVP